MEGRTLGEAAFVAGAKRFARLTRGLAQEWDWVEAWGSGYLKSHTTVAHARRGRENEVAGEGTNGASDSESEEGEEGAQADVDANALPARAAHATNLELHVVHNSAYGAPQLLLLASRDGRYLSYSEVFELLTFPFDASAPPLRSTMTEVEHPLLHTRFLGFHPCATSQWMDASLAAMGALGDAKGGASQEGAHALYLLVWWWFVSAPLPICHDSASERCSLVARCTG